MLNIIYYYIQIKYIFKKIQITKFLWTNLIPRVFFHNNFLGTYLVSLIKTYVIFNTITGSKAFFRFVDVPVSNAVNNIFLLLIRF